ncbi:MAG: glycosyltransferase [Anaerostipes faecalis]|nr:glycosyltransferase [Anaerostipes faecalis]
MDLISVIVPVYNVEKYLKKCINSILYQSYSNIEVLCVDDGSTDASLKILKDFEKQDQRVKVFTQNNAGVSVARNHAILEATGQYLMFVDGDDWIDFDTCEKAMNLARQNDVDMVMWSYIREMRNESRPKQIFQKNHLFNEKEVKERLYRRLFGLLGEELRQPENADAICTVWGKLYKRELVCDRNIEFPDIREIGTYEDGLFNIRVFENVKRVFFTTDIEYHYRRDNVNSITSEYNENLEKQWENLFSMMKQHIKNKELGNSFLKALNHRIALSMIPLGINSYCAPYSVVKRTFMIHQILKKPEYKNAYRQLNLKYFPIYWKIFFGCAKHQCAIGIFILLFFIQRFRGKS